MDKNPKKPKGLKKRSVKAESRKTLDGQINKKILSFFNKVDAPEIIIKRIIDDPNFGISSKRVYGIRKSVANRIISTRNALPKKRFLSIKQIDAIKGVGKDTLNDIFYVFNKETEDKKNRINESENEDYLSIKIIQQQLSENESDYQSFSLNTTVIYHLKLSTVKKIVASDKQSKLKEINTKNRRIYLVDSDPIGLYERPTAIFIFSNQKLESWFGLDAPLILGKFSLPTAGFDPFFQEPLTNIGYAIYALNEIFFQKIPLNGGGVAPLQLKPFDYPRPTSGAKETPPIAVGSNNKPCSPLNLFIGLSLDGTDDGMSLNKNILNGQTKNIARGFKARKYTTKTFTAGVDGNTIDALLKNITNQIPKTFCNCPPDQLVIFIAAHGYGSNPTNKIAMKFQSSNKKSDISWVTHTQMAQKLGKILSKIKKSKIILMFYSCRSSVAFDNGKYNTHLPGALLITSTDKNTLCYTNFGSHLFMCIIDKKNTSWKKLLDCLKKKLKKDRVKDKKTPMPKGDVLILPPP